MIKFVFLICGLLLIPNIAAARSAHEIACWEKHVESVLGKVRYAEGPPHQAFIACRDANKASPARVGGPTVRAMSWRQDKACVLAVYAADVSQPVRNFGNRVRISGKCPDDFVQGSINKAGNEITMGGVTYVVAPGATRGTPK